MTGWARVDGKRRLLAVLTLLACVAWLVASATAPSVWSYIYDGLGAATVVQALRVHRADTKRARRDEG